MQKYDLIVIGAGAAGLLAAGRAAELGAKVLLVEKMRQAGRKLMITGKGRCNVTNSASISEFIKHVYPNGKFLYPAFSKCFSEDILDLLEVRNVPCKLERGGRYFPESDNATDIVNALLRYAKENNVEIKYDTTVKEILKDEGKIIGVKAVSNMQTLEFSTDNVLVSTGGKSYPATGSTGDGYKFAKQLGHTIVEARPALVPIETAGTMAGKLEGLSLKNVNAILWINGKKFTEAFGEMVFTSFGFSGPIILTLSRFVSEALANNDKVEIAIDLKPALDEQKLDRRLQRDLDENGKKKIENIFKSWLPSKLIPVFIESLEIDSDMPGHQVSGKQRKSIKNMMKNLRFEITDVRSFKEAIITAGGVSLAEVNPKTLESKVLKNLYFAGEVLDLDAETGGYNLQIAFSTAWLVAESVMAK